MSSRIIQFGTSRFLQAHAAFFVHEARQSGQDVGPITVVQVSGASSRSGRVGAFGNAEGYPVIIRGMEGGQPVDRTVQVTSVDHGLSALEHWDELSKLFAEEAEFVISNTGDTGYQTWPEEDGFGAARQVPRSFPAKLAALLVKRWQISARPLVILPCELVTGNGRILKQAVIDCAKLNALPAEFFTWLDEHVAFAETLVDRIVSEPIEPIGAVAEPYALWAIKRAPGVRLPCNHPSIVLTDDLEPYERLKLHILNLGHTVLAEIWQRENRPADETVRAILADREIRARLDALYQNEVLPGFAANGLGDDAKAYVATTLDRFLNPFLDHRIADIAQHHGEKVARRIRTFLDWADKADEPLDAPVLKEITARYSPIEAAP
ncbi:MULTISPECIES: mannitol dehydrogenase family protein [Rhizobium]|uniref:Mannitol dehydrogenase family protein n=1 Tax=Rhizobium tropici TaxID=398 RepID=A0A329Y544_RHITR|nr:MULTISPECIES: mannitol dehydrogenase family protein [Rhizobium]MBB3285768.1 tagaturonate reductase [Rhizobium sp. BK252]MBB3400508.1 tagaturonate reductase [Rhizobium sp. BK289]MBB3413087.1 tagaturonate reductase [Rhizobium sp. BK284]MBB3480974.1 tagaturonate reductase [Rhizobium sp. BK347]MDK4721648.1 mannitol dehydrogenase family protein [Rhizobium sp. CNPSo 3968]